MSKLAYTFCTSSWSSNASTTRSTARAADSSAERDRRGRQHREVAARHGDPGFVQRHPHGVQVGRRRGDLPRVAGVDDVLGTRVQGREHEIVLGGGVVLQDDEPLALELPCHRAGLGHRPAVAAQDVLDLRGRAVAVVGEALDEHRDAVRRVALVGHGLVAHALEVAGPALDRAFDRVDRHRRVARLLHHRAQGGIALEVAATLTRRDLDLADQPGEELAARLVGRPLLVLDRVPLGMTAHEIPLTTQSLARTAGARAGHRTARDGTWNPIRRRHARAPARPSYSATTATPAPTRSTTGARMNTPGNAGPASPSTSRSASNESR